MNKKLGLVICLLVIALTVPAMASNTLYTNLGSDGSFNCCSGWTISGTGTLGFSQSIAEEFQVTTAGQVTHIDVAVGYVTGTNSFYVDLDADNGGQPGTVLLHQGDLQATPNFGQCCALVSFDVTNGPTLNPGTNYWLVVGPTDSSSTLWAAWNFSNSATGQMDFSTDGGQTWANGGVTNQGAFQILGGSGGTGTVPEPSSLLLFGTGVVGVFGAFRRKLKL